MRRWLAVLIALWGLAVPFTVRAQTPIKLSTLQIQLWPEYDTPSMLVIYDFRLPDSVKLPVSVAMTFPKDGHLSAVASQAADGSLLNTDYLGPTVTANTQTITIQVQTPTTYHVEYYEPLTRKGQQREFLYIWPGDYAIDDLSISVRIPPDTSNMVTDPIMKATKAGDGSSELIKDFGALGAGQEFPVQVTYTRTSDALGVAAETVQPSKPLGSNTPGRVLLSNYLPYILGGLGIVAIGAASIYLLQPRNRFAAQRRHARRPRPEAPAESRGKTEVYCYQCGARAEPGDRFCRVCGTRLRAGEPAKDE